ncbi:MAG: helix-turn-helix transcriptional regulator [Tissierellia bacterium]|nr:helix-turn-helix transcriptional regulator [Tissierellia bacterium]
MFLSTSNSEGQMLRIARLNKGMELKEVVGNICSISTLSKIERGKQKTHPEVLKSLYKQLDIEYETDELFLKEMQSLMARYYYELTYNFSSSTVHKLISEEKRLLYSPLALDYILIKYIDTGDIELANTLDQCVEFMSDRQLAWFYIEDPRIAYNSEFDKFTKSHQILQNSYVTVNLMSRYWYIGEFSLVRELSSIAINYALDEGNVWTLSQVYSLLGGIFACYNMKDDMLKEYGRALNLLKNTNWKDDLKSIYYNIGATYISIGDYELSEEYLDKCYMEEFNYFHKKAILNIYLNKYEEADYWIEKMKNSIKEFENGEDYSPNGYHKSLKNVLKVTKYQRDDSIFSTDEYIKCLEELMKYYNKNGKYGFMYFHKNALINAYISNRRYKDAYELEGLFSNIKSKHIVKS